MGTRHWIILILMTFALLVPAAAVFAQDTPGDAPTDRPEFTLPAIPALGPADTPG